MKITVAPIRLTESEALALSYELWDRIAKLPDDEVTRSNAKEIVLEAMEYDPDDVLNECFLCEYTRDADADEQDCDRCPVKPWRDITPDVPTATSTPCACLEYGTFIDADSPYDRRAAARAIRDLMKETE